ncbi:Norsolorinic acid ketoreductase nor1 [Fusarium oxysporum f. sp. cubense]|uniref:Norsolorinic acid ketoreductase nor1 n=1 Tax=Fusarium oxysporum f. sp. cubense TaxID=61366 RepID=A0A559KLN3_FUSOC|nr:Norsolorinic acid ketoreductase nor1 [Fusarium oxysporum f. sp. cubense]
MPSSTNTVWVVTGGNRRIGLGFVKALLARPSVTVIATVRNDRARSALEDATANLVKGDGTVLRIAQLDFTTALSPEQIRNSFHIDHVDELWPLLQKSSAPQVINVSSSVGCITYHKVVASAYGPSKAALNWLTSALHQRNEALIAFALHPGFVRTEMGESAATEWGFPHAMLECVEQAVKESLEIIDSATRENVSGKFVSYKGQELPW